jgi:DnaJ-domain-containing protein 1
MPEELSWSGLIGVLLLGFVGMRFVLALLESKDSKAPRGSQDAQDRASDDSAGGVRNQHDSPPIWWQVLEVGPEASLDEIKAAYKRKMSQYHPDNVANLGIELRVLAEKRSQEINAAYDFIVKNR